MSEITCIGRYKIIKELGRGAMSVVYQAEDPEIGRLLAIKLLKHELIEEDVYRELFVREAKSAGRLTHPSIVTIYDTGIWNNRPFIAMELLDGVTLDEYFLLEGPLELEKCLHLAEKLTEAFEYAHRQGVIHRDLKPENIYVLDEGKNFKIVDFGIAKIESEYIERELEGSSSSIEKTNEKERIMGTPAYMSPEQISGHGVDSKTDFYSLGVILYQATKGLLPFKAINHAAMLQAVLQQNPEPLPVTTDSELVWQTIIFRLLQKNPDLRYESSTNLLEEITNLRREHKENQKGLSSINFTSMSTRWAMSLSTVVFFVMVFGMVWVYKKQTDLMNQLMFDYGFSVAQIIAKETAEPLLLDESLSLQSVINKIAENNEILHLNIRNKNGMVIGSSNPKEINRAHLLTEDLKFISKRQQGNIHLDENTLTESVYRFDSPIMYQEKEVGRVNLAISPSNLQQATKISLFAMIIWMLLILVVVFMGVYWLAKQFADRVNISRQKLHEIRVYGQTDALSVNVHDELGRMEQEVNMLAQKMSGLTRTQKITMVDAGLNKELNKELSKDGTNSASLDKTIVIPDPEN